MHRILKPTGSMYLHCDHTANAYIRMALDAIFGARNFRNEIVWKRATAHSDAGRYGNISDAIMFYGKTRETTWNGEKIATPKTQEATRRSIPITRLCREIPIQQPDGSPARRPERKPKHAALEKIRRTHARKVLVSSQNGQVRPVYRGKIHTRILTDRGNPCQTGRPGSGRAHRPSQKGNLARAEEIRGSGPGKPATEHHPGANRVHQLQQGTGVHRLP